MIWRIHMLLLCMALVIPLGGCLTPLQQAALDGDLEEVRKLLNQSADVNEITLSMANAASRGHLEVTRLLLDRGADSNWEVPNTGTSVLQYAIWPGHLDIVRLLLDHGADANHKNSSGSTPLMDAVSLGRAQIVELLLSRGADPFESGSTFRTTGKSCDQVTARKCAEKLGYAGVAKILRQAEARLKQPTLPPVASVPPVSAPAPAVPVITSDVDRVPTFKTATKKNAYAVVIGIESYRQTLPKADFAAHDAKTVSDYLTKVMGYPEENVVTRLNDKAAKTDLEKYFEEWLPSRVRSDDSVFVYYSGHGAPNPKSGEPYLVPYDGDPAFVESTTFPLKRLYAALDKLPAKEIVVMLDSCFSGAGGRSVIAKGMRPMGLSIENPILASGKTMVLAASSGTQVSSTFLEQGHGLLTYFFLKGLQGEGDLNKDGTIVIPELYEYVRPNVERVARNQYNNEQTPQLLASPDLLKRGGGRLVEHVKP